MEFKIKQLDQNPNYLITTDGDIFSNSSKVYKGEYDYDICVGEPNTEYERVLVPCLKHVRQKINGVYGKGLKISVNGKQVYFRVCDLVALNFPPEAKETVEEFSVPFKHVPGYHVFPSGEIKFKTEHGIYHTVRPYSVRPIIRIRHEGENKAFYLDYTIAEHFMERPPGYHLRHKNGAIGDCSLSNLEWFKPDGFSKRVFQCFPKTRKTLEEPVDFKEERIGVTFRGDPESGMWVGNLGDDIRAFSVMKHGEKARQYAIMFRVEMEKKKAGLPHDLSGLPEKSVKGVLHNKEYDSFIAHISIDGKTYSKEFYKNGKTREEVQKEALQWRKEMEKVKEEKKSEKPVEEPFEPKEVENVWCGMKGKYNHWFCRVMVDGVKKTISRSVNKYGNKVAYDLVVEMALQNPLTK